MSARVSKLDNPVKLARAHAHEKIKLHRVQPIVNCIVNILQMFGVKKLTLHSLKKEEKLYFASSTVVKETSVPFKSYHKLMHVNLCNQHTQSTTSIFAGLAKRKRDRSLPR